MMFAPNRNVAVHIDGFARRPRLGVDVANLLPWSRLDDVATRRAEGDSCDLLQRSMRVSMKHRKQLFQSNFSFPDDYKIRPCVEILLDVCARLRAADDRLPSGILSAAQNL